MGRLGDWFIDLRYSKQATVAVLLVVGVVAWATIAWFGLKAQARIIQWQIDRGDIVCSPEPPNG